MDQHFCFRLLSAYPAQEAAQAVAQLAHIVASDARVASRAFD